MTDRQFARILAGLGLSTRQLAGGLGVTVQTVNNYARGRQPIPGPIELIMTSAKRNPEFRAELIRRSLARQPKGKSPGKD